jgi:hypothetical protein
MTFILAVLLFILVCPFRARAAQFHIPSGNVTALIAAINKANANAQDDVINLEPGIYTLQSVDNGNNLDSLKTTGLPVISTNITIRGESDVTTIIQRDENAPLFRIFHVKAGGTLTLEHVAIKGGRIFGGDGGGGILNFGVTKIADSTVRENDVFDAAGGGIFSNGTLNVANSFIFGNTGDIGSGITSGGILNLTDSSVTQNTFGSGIVTGGPTTIRNSTIFSNGDGDFFLGAGGIDHRFDTLEIINSTIAHNLSFDIGGAVANFFGTIRITNSTIADNKAFRAAGIFNDSGTVELQNTILAKNDKDIFGFPTSACQGDISSAGNNLIDDPSGCPIPLLSSDVVGDPGLDSFKDSEEPGKGHFPLLANSSAINAGNNELCLSDPRLSSDQLGNRRDGICDIGSIEFQSGIRVVIDIRPRDDSNSINLKSNGIISVAILSTENFDASSVNPSTVKFGPNEASVRGRAHLRDVDSDGDLDLVLAFATGKTGVSCDDTSMFLSGKTFQGERIFGSDSIILRGCKKEGRV